METNKISTLDQEEAEWIDIRLYETSSSDGTEVDPMDELSDFDDQENMRRRKNIVTKRPIHVKRRKRRKCVLPKRHIITDKDVPVIMKNVKITLHNFYP